MVFHGIFSECKVYYFTIKQLIRIKILLSGNRFLLDMKTECEMCKAELFDCSAAMICSFECTFCLDCANALNNICNNCNGELTIRPKRKAEN